MDKEKIENYILKGLISRQWHFNNTFQILNYAPIVQYNKLWDEITLKCRGLILDRDYNVLANPFPKFFNYSELQPNEIPNEPFEVYEKLDGSLGILYWIDDVPYIATRGSFESEQAKKATEMLHTFKNRWSNFKEDRTYLFEIIYPANRIVCSYGLVEDLFLLAVIDNETGKDLPLEYTGFPIVKRYDGIKDLSTLKSLIKPDHEGFVIKFNNGFRLKIKGDEYVRLHKILTQTSSTAIWEMLKDNQPMTEILERVPDEFYNYVRTTKNNLEKEYKRIEDRAETGYKELLMKFHGEESNFYNRKNFAMDVMKDYKDVSSIIFNMRDNKQYESIIWKMCRPKFEKPFRIEI